MAQPAASSFSSAPPDHLLFVQHGWADTNRDMLQLAQALATPTTQAVVPCLNYVMTWLRIAPLINRVDALATAARQRHPHCPLRIVGHSMGGLIWLEVLTRHPDWWPQVDSLVLIGSPVGGSELARKLDPLGIGFGIAADLGQSRRSLGLALAQAVPTLVIAGDIGDGSDGTVPVTATPITGAGFVCLAGVRHAALKRHPAVVNHIQRFWRGERPEPLPGYPLVAALQAIPGMTDNRPTHLAQAQPVFTLADGTQLRRWRSPLGIDHLYVVAGGGTCLYAGYVGWAHQQALVRALAKLQTDLASPVPAG